MSTDWEELVGVRDAHFIVGGINIFHNVKILVEFALIIGVFIRIPQLSKKLNPSVSFFKAILKNNGGA